ncbi:MAG: family N-acetyltransferase [Verrucomicrobiaceae bacterium]|nr:family N-acetyltransferase [Verrucomicrobiaceae bacterium]
MAEIQIRAAENSDIAIVASMFDLYRQFYEQAANIVLAREFITARMQRDESIILLAINTAGEGKGFCQLYRSFCSVEASSIYVLYDLFVRDDMRGTGIGRSLLLAAEAHARTSGVARMDLTTGINNLPAQALYESLGWLRDKTFFTYSRRTTD